MCLLQGKTHIYAMKMTTEEMTKFKSWVREKGCSEGVQMGRQNGTGVKLESG